METVGRNKPQVPEHEEAPRLWCCERQQPLITALKSFLYTEEECNAWGFLNFPSAF